MIAMSVRDKHIVNPGEVNSQSLRVTDKHVAGSCIEQDVMLLRFEKDRKAVLCFEYFAIPLRLGIAQASLVLLSLLRHLKRWIVCAIIYKYRPLHIFIYNTKSYSQNRMVTKLSAGMSMVAMP